jgi:hypothetical protein
VWSLVLLDVDAPKDEADAAQEEASNPHPDDKTQKILASEELVGSDKLLGHVCVIDCLDSINEIALGVAVDVV